MATNKGFERKNESQPMTYWQRANRAYYYVYGFSPPELWEKEDGKAGCEYAVIATLATLHDVKNTNPLTKKYKTSAELLTWFNEKHPLKDNPIICL